MEQNLIENVYAVIDELKELAAYQRLLALKKTIEEDPDITTKIRSFKQLNAKYDEVKKYGKHHPDLAKIQASFRQAKLDLYQDEMVAEYKQLEQRIQQELDAISRAVAQTVSPKIKHPNDMGFIKRH